MTAPILWRCIKTPSLVHAFRDKGSREAICGRKVRWSWGWTLPQHDARRCEDCEMVMREEGVKP